MRTVAFHVNFENSTEVTGKRQVLRGWSEDALRAALNRNRVETMRDADGAALRQLLSGSILIRCELARRTADATLAASMPAPERQPCEIRKSAA